MNKIDDVRSALERFPIGQEFCIEHVRIALKKYYGLESVSTITVKKVFNELIIKGDLLLTERRRGPYPNLYMKK